MPQVATVNKTKSKTTTLNKTLNKTLVLPLTNVFAKGDFTATLFVGSEQAPVNVIVDTGSSTLVIEHNRYQPSTDKSLKATTIAQEIGYGIGGWAGPLVHTQLHLLDHQENTLVAETSVAIVEAEPTQMFGDADGILGLAYKHLNKTFDITEFLKAQNISPQVSLPWPFTIDKSVAADAKPPLFNSLKSFKSFLWQYPEHDLKALFTQLADSYFMPNSFGFSVKRSSIHVQDNAINAAKVSNETPAQQAQLQQDPLNKGELILGDALNHYGHSEEDFVTIDVFHDIYYNAELISVTIGDNTPITAPPLSEKHVKNYYTNAIIDTGANLIVLPNTLFENIRNALIEHNSEFEPLIDAFKSIEAQYQGIAQEKLDLSQWPNITFTFKGENGEPVDLVCPPSHYWQTNTPTNNTACFKLLGQLPNWPNQSIIGLPLISRYYAVFDRAVNATGVIRFAQHK